jgi:Tfp pilus assembly protein PilN
VWLTAIRLEAGGGALALEGRALDAARVPAYIQGLRREPLLAGTTLAAIDLKSSEHEASDGVSFRLVAAEQRGAQHGGNTRPASPAAARGNLP